MKKKARMWGAMAIAMILCAACGGRNIEQGELHYSVGKDLIDKGDQARGIAELLKAYEADPKNPEVNELLGLVYSEKDQPEKAIFHLQEAVRLSPQNPDFHNNLCTVFLKVKRADEAIPQCQAAASDITYTTPERSYNNLGYAYQLKGDRRQAEASYRQALLHNKAFFLAHLNLGKLYFEEGRIKEAIASLIQARQGCDACVEPAYRLGIAYLKNKQSKLAKEAFSKCQQLDQSGEAGKECREYARKIK